MPSSLEPCQTLGRVAELMTPDPVTAAIGATLREVWWIMTERRFRHMPVVDDEGRLQGILSQSDLLVATRSAEGRVDFDDERPVTALMHTEIDRVRVDCCAAEAARHMLRTKRSCLPVVDEEDRLVGILTEADYLRLATRGVPPCTCGGVASTRA